MLPDGSLVTRRHFVGTIPVSSNVIFVFLQRLTMLSWNLNPNITTYVCFFQQKISQRTTTTASSECKDQSAVANKQKTNGCNIPEQHRFQRNAGANNTRWPRDRSFGRRGGGRQQVMPYVSEFSILSKRF